MEIDITVIVEAVISLCAALISVFLIPWVKKKIGAEKMAEFLRWVDIGVAAAEQLFTTDATQAKKEYVLDFLREKGVVFDEWEVDVAVEAAVIKLHTQLYGQTTKDGVENG
jgi:hypothetical protein